METEPSEPRPLRIALVSPKGPLYRHRGGIFGRGLRYQPLTLPTLAALVPDDIHAEITCIDEGIQDVDPGLDADIVGLTVITGTAPRAYELAAHYRRRGATVVLGGPHVTLAPDDAQPHADTVVVGYAEDEWPRLLRDHLAGERLPRYTQAADLDLSGRPWADRSVLPRRNYLTTDVFEATRACIHNCSFCVVPVAWGRQPLHKPVEEIVAEIRAKGSRRAVFIDLNLIADRSYARRLFRALVSLEIEWYGLATTLLCDDVPLLDLVAASGCRGLLMGFESIAPANLDANQKRFNSPADYPRVVELLHERGISLQGCFVFGLDHDTPDVFEHTAQLAIDIGIDLPRFAIVTPFPGTALYRRLEAEGRIIERNWERYDGQHVVFQPKHLTVAELQEGTEAAWKLTYSWPNTLRRLRRTAAPLHVAVATNLGYRRYANNLDRFYTCDLPRHSFPSRSRTSTGQRSADEAVPEPSMPLPTSDGVAS